jgi:hypothetical protein
VPHHQYSSRIVPVAISLVIAIVCAVVLTMTIRDSMAPNRGQTADQRCRKRRAPLPAKQVRDWFPQTRSCRLGRPLPDLRQCSLQIRISARSVGHRAAHKRRRARVFGSSLAAAKMERTLNRRNTPSIRFIISGGTKGFLAACGTTQKRKLAKTPRRPHASVGSAQGRSGAS